MAESDHSGPDDLDDDPGAGQRRQDRPRRRGGVVGGLIALFAIYMFLAAINLMGGGLKSIAEVPQGKEWMDGMFGCVAHPLAGLFVGILVTSLVQSSSFTTTFTVGLVASGQISLPAAIPVIMGANIGTSVTNLLVSLAHIRRRQEFRRSLGGAIVHDFFNVLSVMVILPLEVAFGVVSGSAGALAHWLAGSEFSAGNPKQFNLVKMAVKPVLEAAHWLLADVLGLSAIPTGALQAVLAVVLLFVALFLLVKVLQGLLRDRLSGLFDRTIFRNPATAFTTGVLTTAAVQSSSVTTSLVVPLIGAGILKIKQVYPYMLGANVGTTVTAILGALAIMAMKAGMGPAAEAAAVAGLAVALGHLLFNCFGILIFWPLGWIPISLAKGWAKLASERRILAAVYLIFVFFVLPIAVIILVNL